MHHNITTRWTAYLCAIISQQDAEHIYVT